MWWLRRMTTVAVPYCRARGMAMSIARAVSQTPGSRWPSQVSAGPGVADHQRLAHLGHGAGRQPVEIAGQQGEAMGRVAHEVGLDQQLADQAGAAGLDAGGGEEERGEVDQVGGLMARLGHAVVLMTMSAPAAARAG